MEGGGWPAAALLGAAMEGGGEEEIHHVEGEDLPGIGAGRGRRFIHF